MAFLVFCCIGIAYIAFPCTIAIVTTLSMVQEYWSQILNEVELSSTRMLLSQQAQLVRVEKKESTIVYVMLEKNWKELVLNRKDCLITAVKKIFGNSSEVKFIIPEDNNAA